MKNKKEFTLRNMYCNRKAKRQIKRIMSHFLIFPPIILNFCLAPRRAQELGWFASEPPNCAKHKFSTRQGCVISVEDTHGLYGDKDSRGFAEKHRPNAQQRQGRDCGAACSHRAPYERESRAVHVLAPCAIPARGSPHPVGGSCPWQSLRRAQSCLLFSREYISIYT